MSKRSNKTPKTDDDGSSTPKNPKVGTEGEGDVKTENVLIPGIGKSFVLKQTFEKILEMKEGGDKTGRIEEHFGFEWEIYIQRINGHLGVYLRCKWPENADKSTIEVDFNVILLPNTEDTIVKKGSNVFKRDNSEDIWGFSKLIEWSKMESDFVVDNKINVEIHVKILKTTDLYQPKLSDFSKESSKNHSDLALVVNGERFYISKHYLARQSDVFDAMFFGEFVDSEKSEIELNDVDAQDFQLFLELLHCQKVIHDITVEGILLIADMYNVRVVIQHCEDFLLESSKKPKKKKFQMSIKYHLERLKTQMVSEIKTIDDVRSVFSKEEIADLEPSVTVALLQNAMENQ